MDQKDKSLLHSSTNRRFAKLTTIIGLLNVCNRYVKSEKAYDHHIHTHSTASHI